MNNFLGGKMIKSLLVILASVSTMAFADPTPTPAPTPAPGCDLIRQANAVVKIIKNTYALQNGIWVQSQNEVERVTVTVPVIGNSNVGCQYNTLRVDNVMLNGNPETVNVNAYIRVVTSANPPYKDFSASYWLTSSESRQGWASAFSNDMTMAAMGLNINLESGLTTTSLHPDILTVQVMYTDNAQ
jgi:hypothetical protein